MEPKCPKCQGKLMRVPDGTYPNPTIRCTSCSWQIEQMKKSFMDCERKPPSEAVVEGSRRGGKKSKDIPKIDVDVAAVAVKVYVAVNDGKYIHLFKADYAGKNGKNAKCFCGVTGMKTTETGGLTVCKTCFKNYEKVRDDPAKNGTGETQSTSSSPSQSQRTRAREIHVSAESR